MKALKKALHKKPEGIKQNPETILPNIISETTEKKAHVNAEIESITKLHKTANKKLRLKNEEDLRVFSEVKKELENAVKERTKELEQKNSELERVNKKLIFQNAEKEKRAAELSIANIELAFQNNEKEKRAAELKIANVELAFQNNEKEKRAAELKVANVELAFQNNEKEKRAAELVIANSELTFQNNEKEKRASELGLANIELAFQNDEKEKRATELSNANRDLVSFTHISSHDLQEPLRKIQIFGSCILKDDEKNLSDAGKGYFKRMMDTAGRMQNLIDDLLIYSSTKNDDRIFEDTDLTVIIEEVKKDFEEELKEKKAIIETGNLCRLFIMPFQFRQLLHNLVSNSLKFSKENVPVHIVIESTIIRGNDLLIAGLSAKNYCHLSFTDNGIGFDPQYKDRVFEVFQRLHTVAKYSGTGIGLAICKRIIENHKGIITATGRPDEGVRFDMYIPA